METRNVQKPTRAAMYPPRRMLMKRGKSAVRSQPAEMELACERENERRGKSSLIMQRSKPIATFLNRTIFINREGLDRWSKLTAMLVPIWAMMKPMAMKAVPALVARFPPLSRKAVMISRGLQTNSPNKVGVVLAMRMPLRSREGQTGISDFGSAILLRRGGREEKEDQRTRGRR